MQLSEIQGPIVLPPLPVSAHHSYTIFPLFSSVCPDHKWQRKSFFPGKWSVFALENDEGEMEEPQQPALQEEQSGDEEGGCGGEGPVATALQLPWQSPTGRGGADGKGGASAMPAEEAADKSSTAKSSQNGASSSGGGGASHHGTSKGKSGKRPSTTPHCSKPTFNQHKFIIQGGNAAPM